MTETQAIEPSPSPGSVALEVEDLLVRLKSSRIKVSPPAPNTRASTIGHPCDRYTFYERTLPADMRIPHSVELQAIFDLGKWLEPFAFRELEDAGIEIVRRGRDHSDPKLQISGHVDADIRLPRRKEIIPAEVKGLNPYTAGTIESIDDIREHHQAWVRKYYSQLQLYLYFESAPFGLFVLLNKATGGFKIVACPIDYDHVEGLLKKAERIVLAVAQNTPPPRNQSEECQRCQFAHECAPDLHFGPGAMVFDDGELEAKIKRHEELKLYTREHKVLADELGVLLPKREGEILVGDWVAIRKLHHRRGLPRPFYTTEYRKLTK